MLIHRHAFARAGLIGNPSDGYFGKTIALTVRNFAARTTCYESPRLAILPQHCDRTEYAGIADLIHDVEQNGYYGGIRLIKAAIKGFADYCRKQSITLPPRQFTLEYQTNIPIRVGLAGSSAIVTATMRALMAFYNVDIPKPVLPNIILGVELQELGIGAGLQDRVAQVYEGVVFMDFNKDHMEQHGHGCYESLDPAMLPPLYVAYHDRLAEGTEVTHNDLRARYNRGEKEVHDAIATWAGLTRQARDLIVAGKGASIGPLMDANYDLRTRLIRISEGNQQLVAIGRKHGAAVNFAGSGGAVVGMYDGDPGRLAKLTVDYVAMGAKVLTPEITGETDR